MAKALPLPRVWTPEELDASRRLSENLFTGVRKEEGPRAFSATYRELRPRVEALMESTRDFRQVDAGVFLQDPTAWQPCRYVLAPPVSQEDFWTMVGGSKFQRVPPRLAEEVAEAMRPVIDPVRFPWLEDRRGPTLEEREIAITSTTLMWAAQHLGTIRRGEVSKRQEEETAKSLESAGLTLDPSRAAVTYMDDMSRGTFSKERPLAGAKCDVPVRLSDGRLMAIECKVSNGPKNGWKRVNREVGGKAETWRIKFGTQALTAVVLAGSFDLSCLVAAQNAGVSIYWQHELEDLTDFVSTLP